MSKTWMLTQSRRRVEPLNFRVEDVFLPDIAASLAKQCRYNGHVDHYYSVAEHSVLISRALEQKYIQELGGFGTLTHSALLMARIGLLHDAAEAYTGDVIRPLKNALREAGFDIKPYEEAIERCVSVRFGLPWSWPDAVHWADNAIIRDEKEQLKYDPTNTWDDFGAPEQGLGVKIEAWGWEQAQREFMYRAYELGLT